MTSTRNNHAETTSTSLRKDATKDVDVAADADSANRWHTNFAAAAFTVGRCGGDSCAVGHTCHSASDNCDRPSQLSYSGMKRSELGSKRKRWMQAQRKVGKEEEEEKREKVTRKAPQRQAYAADDNGERQRVDSGAANFNCGQRCVGTGDVAPESKPKDFNGYQSISQATCSISAPVRRRQRQRHNDRSYRRNDHHNAEDVEPAGQRMPAADEPAGTKVLSTTIRGQFSTLPKEIAVDMGESTAVSNDKIKSKVAEDVCKTQIKFNSYRECLNELCRQKTNMRKHFHCCELACRGGRALIGEAALVRHIQRHRQKQQQQQQQQEKCAVTAGIKVDFVANRRAQPPWPTDCPSSSSSSSDETAEKGVEHWQSAASAESLAVDNWLAEDPGRSRSTSLPLLAATAAASTSADGGPRRAAEKNFYMRYRMLAASKVAAAAALLARATTEATATAQAVDSCPSDVQRATNLHSLQPQQCWPLGCQDQAKERSGQQQAQKQPEPTKEVTPASVTTSAATITASTAARAAAVSSSNTLQITSIDGFFNRKRGRPPKNRFVEVYKNTQQSPQAIFTSFKLEKQGGQVHAQAHPSAAYGSLVLMGAAKECDERLQHPPIAGPTLTPTPTHPAVTLPTAAATFEAAADQALAGGAAVGATPTNATLEQQPLPKAAGSDHFRPLRLFDKQPLPLHDASQTSSLASDSAADASQEHSVGVFNAQKADKTSVVRAAGTFYPENGLERPAHADGSRNVVASSKQLNAKRSIKVAAMAATWSEYSGQVAAQCDSAPVEDANVPQDLRVNIKSETAAAHAQQTSVLCSRRLDASRSARRKSAVDAATAVASISLHFKQLLQFYQQQQQQHQPQQQPYYFGFDSVVASAPVLTAAAYLPLLSSSAALPDVQQEQQQDYFPTTTPSAASVLPLSSADYCAPLVHSADGSTASTPVDLHAVSLLKSLTPAAAAAAATATQQQNLLNIMVLSAAASRGPLSGLLTQQPQQQPSSSSPSPSLTTSVTPTMAVAAAAAAAGMRLKQDVQHNPAGYSKFRFNEDCGFAKCGYRNRQSHFHCNRRNCHYSFCDKTRFVQHTARHERLDTIMGDDFQQYRANVSCGYANCSHNRGYASVDAVAPKKSSHFHCLKCDFICADTNKVVAHRRLHSKMEYIRLAGFRKVPSTENCVQRQLGDACAYSLKHTHYHCLVCDYSVLSRTQLASHRHKTGAAKIATAATTSATVLPMEAAAAEAEADADADEQPT